MTVRTRSVVLALLSVVVVSAPFLAIWALFLVADDQLSELDPRPGPMWVPVTIAPLNLTLDGAMAVSFTERDQVRSPVGLEGLVTAVHVDIGSLLRTGDPVMDVDDVTRIAAASPRPFHRPLRRGSQGSDVAMLNRILRELGLGAPLSDTFDSSTRAAVRELAGRLGASTDVFDPSWFLWLPDTSIEVDLIEVEVGTQVLGPGSTVIVGSARLAALEISAADNPVDIVAEFELVARGTAISRVRWVESAWAVSASDLLVAEAELRTALGEAQVLEGRLVPVAQVKTIQVPSSAVASGIGGSTCVWVPGTYGPEALDVEVVWSTPFGESQLSTSLAASEVLANPRQVLEAGGSCP